MNSCVFAVQLSDPRERDGLERRIEALDGFYGPLGRTELTTSYLEPLRLIVGQISFNGRPPGPGPLTWGGPLPSSLADDRALVSAGDGELRAADGVVVAVAAGDRAARMISGAGGVATLHRSTSGDAEVFATHAVAAAWLATGRVSIAPDRIPELIAREYVGGERALIADVAVMPPAARIDFTPNGVSVGSFWPVSERWELLDEELAYEHARVALLESLERRVPERGAHLGLTGGLDSRVVALALHELGRSVGVFTWGEPDWEDVIAGATTAAELGLEHRRQPIEYRDDQQALDLVGSEVRWSEGVTPVRFMAQTWPPEMTAAVYGTAGEVGRAFYYAPELVRGIPEPSQEELERFFDGRARIQGAHREALERLRASEREWIADAHAGGMTGWRCLDFVYAEQRVRRWGRAMLSQLDAITVPSFATPEVTRALASMSLRDRLDDRFHRRFLSRMPALAEAAPHPAPPRSPLRRAVAPVLGARRIAGVRRARRERGRWYAADAWSSRPRLQAWISEEVLGSTLIEEALGTRWARATRTAFLRGESPATENALLAAAPVALDSALRELQVSGPAEGPVASRR